LTISWHTWYAACLTPDSSPLAAFWQMVSSLLFSSLVSVGAVLMLDLQADTASAMAGLAAAAALPPLAGALVAAAALELAVVAAADDDDALDDELPLLLLLPQPAMATAPMLATTHNKPSLLVTMCPLVSASSDPLVG